MLRTSRQRFETTHRICETGIEGKGTQREEGVKKRKASFE